MKITRSAWLIFTLVTVALLPFVAGCEPPLDSSLSPPIIVSPIYACADKVGYYGADHESKIWLYVNGSKVKEVDSFWGSGEITLTTPLSSGDVVSASQIVNNLRSEKTRDPVTVQNIPSALLDHGEKIKNPPEIQEPLYECQQVVLINKVINGATVTLRNDVGGEWKGSTPYPTRRQGTPKLEAGQKYDVKQEICTDNILASDWSAKVTVQAKPTSMPIATIREPLVVGSDTCIVDGLILGAKVDIYADDGSGVPVRVGGGSAWAGATIYRITPVVDSSNVYYAIQGLCEVESPKPADPTVPEPTVPVPSVQKPICNGEYYVTICDTIPGATIKVYADGTQIAQASGFGGCVKIALGDNYTFSTSQSIKAEQLIGGTASASSAVVTVTADGAPDYNPSIWNDSFHIVRNNCYGYACDILGETSSTTKQQPGRAHGVEVPFGISVTCSNIGTAAQADGLALATSEKQCEGCTHLVALVIAPGGGRSNSKPLVNDYHWYRLDSSGSWSNKPGWNPATNVDASGNTISNPETADRRYEGTDYILDYNTFCTYYCVDKDIVVIK